MSSERFGRRAAKASSAAELLELEREDGRAERFEMVDRLTGEILVAALRGERPLSTESGDLSILRLKGITPEQKELLEELFSLEKQQSRGTWSLAETVTAKVGIIHFAANLSQFGRFAHAAAADDRHRISLAGSPEAPYCNAVLEPLFEALYEPFGMRAGQAANKSREEQIRRWEATDDLFSSLGFEVEREIAVMRYGGGWSRLRAAEQLEAKRQLLAALAEQVEVSTASRYRAHRLLPLLARYYKRADRKGKALRKRILTRELERTVSAYFGGGWLDFLDYLGEEPHPDEHVATALPETRLYLGTTRKAASELGVEGLNEDQLRLITTSIYGAQNSPVERRLEAMRRYWEVFDSAHASQSSGMKPLWGLVAEGRRVELVRFDDASPYQDRLYERLLPEELLSEIGQLWGTRMVSRSLERIVTEPFPHVAMAEALGPALRFWHGCALTAWFVCEGPYSRTDMAGLEEYHHRDLQELERLGVTVDRRLFADLLEAEERLGPEQPAHEQTIEFEIEPGVMMQTSFTTGVRREGFEILRDVITEHRRSWTGKHLRDYLSKRAEGDIRAAAETFYKMTHDRSGKTPTVKQFTKTAQTPANRWFGGDISALYRAFGEKSPVSSERSKAIPEDVHSFVMHVYVALGGQVEPFKRFHSSEEESNASMARMQISSPAFNLANLALNYLQLEEALARPPTLKELGRTNFERRAGDLLGADVERSYAGFAEIVTNVRRSMDTRSRTSSHDELAGHADPGGSEVLGPRERAVPDEEDSEHADAGRHSASVTDQANQTAESRRRPWWRRLLRD